MSATIRRDALINQSGHYNAAIVSPSDTDTLLSSPLGNYVLPQSSAVLVAALGDSITAGNSANTVFKFKYTGYLTCAESYLNGAIDFQPAMNFGIGGNTTTQMLARTDAAITAMLAAGVRMCFFLGGTNDPFNGVTYTDTLSNYSAIFKKFRDAGIRLLVLSILPRANASGQTDVTQAIRQRFGACNAWLQKYCDTHSGIHFFDMTRTFVDYTATGTNLGDPIGGNTGAVTALTADGLHPQKPGNYRLGKRIAAYMVALGLVPSRPPRWLNPADVANATSNPGGNALTNGILDGTGGPITGGNNGVTGVCATGWNLRTSVGAAVGSKGTLSVDDNTIPTQVVTLSTGANTFILEQVLTPANLAAMGIVAGDTVYAEATMPGTNLVNCTRLEMTVTDGVGGGAQALTNTVIGPYLPSEAPGYLRTPNFVLSAGFTSLVLNLIGATAAGGAGVFTASGVSFRKVIAQ